MFNFLFLLPQLLNVGKDVARCLEGGMTQQEYNDLLDSLSALVASIPALAGFMAIIQSVIKVARVSFPLIEEIKNLKPAAVTGDASTIKMGAAKKEVDKLLTKEDIARANRSLTLLSDLSVRMAAEKKVAQDPKTKKTIDTSWMVDPTRNG